MDFEDWKGITILVAIAEGLALLLALVVGSLWARVVYYGDIPDIAYTPNMEFDCLIKGFNAAWFPATIVALVVAGIIIYFWKIHDSY